MLERSVANETSTVTTQRRPGAEDPTAVDLVTRILEYAAVSRASDIHIEPYELEAIIRYRIDGTLQEVLSLPPTILPPLVARVKSWPACGSTKDGPRRMGVSRPTWEDSRSVCGYHHSPPTGAKKLSYGCCQKKTLSWTWRIWDWAFPTSTSSCVISSVPSAWF